MNPVDARVRRSRDALRLALLDLLQEKSFEDITVREVTVRSRVGYTTFFRHFPSLDALLDHLVLIEIECLTGQVLPIYDSADSLGACRALCSYVDQRRPLWSALLNGGAATKVKQAMLDQSRPLVAGRRLDRSLPADLDNALAIVLIVELLAWWLRQAVPWQPDQIADVLYDRVIVPARAQS